VENKARALAVKTRIARARGAAADALQHAFPARARDHAPNCLGAQSHLSGVLSRSRSFAR
jgi:hypothetical protein